jgi:hypothetical protein
VEHLLATENYDDAVVLFEDAALPVYGQKARRLVEDSKMLDDGLLTYTLKDRIRTASGPLRPRVHVCNTDVYVTLRKQESGMRAAYINDIYFDYRDLDVLILPIHAEAHFSTLVIVNPAQALLPLDPAARSAAAASSSSSGEESGSTVTIVAMPTVRSSVLLTDEQMQAADNAVLPMSVRMAAAATDTHTDADTTAPDAAAGDAAPSSAVSATAAPVVGSPEATLGGATAAILSFRSPIAGAGTAGSVGDLSSPVPAADGLAASSTSLSIGFETDAATGSETVTAEQSAIGLASTSGVDAAATGGGVASDLGGASAASTAATAAHPGDCSAQEEIAKKTTIYIHIDSLPNYHNTSEIVNKVEKYLQYALVVHDLGKLAKRSSRKFESGRKQPDDTVIDVALDGGGAAPPTHKKGLTRMKIAYRNQAHYQAWDSNDCGHHVIETICSVLSDLRPLATPENLATKFAGFFTYPQHMARVDKSRSNIFAMLVR